MSEEELSALEQYILSSHSEESLKQFPSTSEYRRYLELSRLIESDPLDPSIEEAISSISDGENLSARLRLRHLLKTYDRSPDPELLTKLNQSTLGKTFDYQAPRNIESSEIETFPSRLTESPVNLEEACKTEKVFNTLTDSGKLLINLDQTTDQIFRKILSQGQLWKYSNISSRFLKFFSSNRGFSETECFKNMSLNQLSEISSKDKEIWKNGSFIRAWLKKEYFCKATSMKDDQKYEYFKALAATFEGDDNLPDSIRTVAFLNVLSLEKKLGIVDETWFFKYLKYRRPSNWYIDEKPTDKSLTQYEQFLDDRSLDEDSLLRHFIPAFLFKSFDLIEKFKNLFKFNYFEPIMVKTQILKGLPIENLEKYSKDPIFTSIELEPLPDNPKEFTRTDQVSFRMNVKNIPRLTLRVLELNPKSYYLKNLKEIDSNIELNGLVPSFEKIFEFLEGPSIRTVKTFDFPELSEKVGIFVIEFFGNGRKSRVIIKKGCLRYVAKETISGHLVFVLNENNKVSKTGGVYLDGRFFEVDPEDGHISLPFCRVPSSKPLVLTDGEIYELVKNFSHCSENYELKTAFLISSEQLVARTTCKFFVKPVLYVNGIRAPSELITQSKVTLTTVDSENVQSKKVYSDLEVPDAANAIPVMFEVPLNLKRVMVEFNAVVVSVEDEKINLRSDFTLDVNPSLGNSNVVSSAFLTRIDNQFLIQMRGINGEPICKQIVEVKCKSSLTSTLSTEKLQTDEKGQIHLGSLENIEILTLIVKKDPSSESYDWNLSSFTEKINYPSLIRLCEGDEFSLPVAPSSFHSNNLWFCSFSENYLIEDLTSKLPFKAETSCIVLNDLPAGSYQLQFRSGELIQVEVLEGLHLGRHFILQDKQAEVTNEDYQTIGISSITREPSEVLVDLSGKFDENSVVFGYFFNFFSPDLLQVFSSLLSLNKPSVSQTFQFSSSKNMYLPSAQLDEEYQYVIDRKSHSRFIGSTLDKPQLLLKRFFMTDTKTETQQARPGDMFQDKILERACMMQSAKRSLCPRRDVIMQKGISIPFDFLTNPAVLLSSKVTKGRASFSVPGNFYNFIAFAYNSASSAFKHISLCPEISLRDLRLKTSAKDSTEVFNSRAVFPGETMKLQDFNSTSLEVVDNFSDLMKIVKTLAKTSGYGKDFELCDLVADWHRLSFEKKKESFDKFVSHELNLFIYKRDPKFFEQVVKPFVLCKMQKDFVDRFLCGFDLKEEERFDRIVKMNLLEMVLLVERIKENNQDLAKRVVNMLKDKAKAQKLDEKVRIIRIQAVLSANSTGRDNRRDLKSSSSSEEGASYGGRGGGGGESEMMCEAEMMCEDEDEDIPRPKIMYCSKDDESDDSLPQKKSRVSAMRDRQALPKYYKKLDETKEFKETYYYNSKSVPILDSVQLYSEISESLLNNTPWLSESIIHSFSSESEILLAFTFASIESRASRPNIKIVDNEWSLTCESPVLVFYRELGNSKLNLNPLIFMGCNYFELSEEEVKQFVKEKIYRCSYTITNTTANQLQLTVLTQAPEGSISLKPEIPSKTHFVSLKPYTTRSIYIFFYFPFSGDFTHVPGNVALNQEICAVVNEKTIHVQDLYKATNFESFKDLVIGGQKELILDFLQKNSLEDSSNGFSLYDILWMMKNQTFWQSVVEIYRKKLVFNYDLWGFAFFHKDSVGISEYLMNDSYIRSILGYFFSSSLVSTEGEDFRHTEFDPLVNARAYRLGGNQRITNTRFKEVYTQYLKFLSEKPGLNNSDLLCLTQYFIYQERYQEAKELYSRVTLTPSNEHVAFNDLQIQFDYLTCYLDLGKAKDISKLYENHPVPTWHKLFAEVRQLIQEIDSEEQVVFTSKQVEPSLNFTVENDSLSLTYENVSSCVVRIYEIDLEVLFSKTPFLIKDVQGFSYVKPNTQISLELTDSHRVFSLEEFKGKNVLIEVDYKTSTVTKSYFSHLLVVNLVERFGVVKVMSKEHKPRPGCYVKAFVRRTGGQVEFYKDGYTDIRGKFDYVSLNTDSLGTVDKFALLVVDDQLGSTVLEASKPPQ